MEAKSYEAYALLTRLQTLALDTTPKWLEVLGENDTQQRRAIYCRCELLSMFLQGPLNASDSGLEEAAFKNAGTCVSSGGLVSSEKASKF